MLSLETTGECAQCWFLILRLSGLFWGSVKDRFYLGLSKIKIPWKIVNNGTKLYVVQIFAEFFYCHSLFDRQYHWAWSWLIVALVTICCWPSRPTFPFSLRIRSAWRKCWAFRPTKYCDQSYNEPRSCSVILSILMQNDNTKILQISELQQLV